jgi:hypothetical protein
MANWNVTSTNPNSGTVQDLGGGSFRFPQNSTTANIEYTVTYTDNAGNTSTSTYTVYSGSTCQPSPTACTCSGFSASKRSVSFGSGADSSTVMFSKTGDCTGSLTGLTASRGSYDWITVDFNSSHDTLTISVSENMDTTTGRTGSITISYNGSPCNNLTITVEQSRVLCDCNAVSFSSTATIGADGGNATFGNVATQGCGRQVTFASSDDSWLTASVTSSGLTATATATQSQRTGTITVYVNGNPCGTCTMTQSAPTPTCSVTKMEMIGIIINQVEYPDVHKMPSNGAVYCDSTYSWVQVHYELSDGTSSDNGIICCVVKQNKSASERQICTTDGTLEISQLFEGESYTNILDTCPLPSSGICFTQEGGGACASVEFKAAGLTFDSNNIAVYTGGSTTFEVYAEYNGARVSDITVSSYDMNYTAPYIDDTSSCGGAGTLHKWVARCDMDINPACDVTGGTSGNSDVNGAEIVNAFVQNKGTVNEGLEPDTSSYAKIVPSVGANSITLTLTKVGTLLRGLVGCSEENALGIGVVISATVDGTTCSCEIYWDFKGRG